MKEATGELNLTVVIVIIVALLSFFSFQLFGLVLGLILLEIQNVMMQYVLVLVLIMKAHVIIKVLLLSAMQRDIRNKRLHALGKVN